MKNVTIFFTPWLWKVWCLVVCIGKGKPSLIILYFETFPREHSNMTTEFRGFCAWQNCEASRHQSAALTHSIKMADLCFENVRVYICFGTAVTNRNQELIKFGECLQPFSSEASANPSALETRKH